MFEVDVGVRVRVDEAAGFRAFISAASGYGKSYLAAKLAEEFMERGFQVVIVDPEGEYYTLRERYRLLVVGRDVPLSLEDADLYARLAVERGVNLILDLSSESLSDLEAQEFFEKFGEALFKLEGVHRRPLILVVEEAEVFAPQYAKPGSLSTCNRIAKRGRKRGLHSVWVTQRSQDFSKMVLSQCNVFFVGRLTHERDLKAVEPYVHDTEALPRLQPGEFYFVCGDQRQIFKVAARKTPHGAETPFTPLEVKAPELSTLARELKELLERRRAERERELSEVERLKSRVAELERQLEEKDREIERLRVAHEAIQLIPGIASGDSSIVNQLRALMEKVERLEAMQLSPQALRRQLKLKAIYDELTGRDEEVYSYIKQHPGCSKAHLLRELGISSTKLEESLSRLKRLRLIEAKRRSGRYHFYARELGS